MAAVSTVALIATAPGQTLVLSQLNLPLRTALDIEPISLNSAYTLATVLAALPLVRVGRLVDRFGPRRALATIAAAFSLACVLMATVQEIVSVFLGFFFLRLLGQGALALVSQHTLAMWFHRRLGAIQGVKQVVLFLAWMPLPLLATALIQALGWRWTYVIFGLVVAGVVIPLALLLVRDRPEDLGLRMDGDPLSPVSLARVRRPPVEDSQRASSRAAAPVVHGGIDETRDWTLSLALRTRAYWTLAAFFFVSPLVGTALLFDLQSILALEGVDASAAAWPISVWSGTMALASFPSGLLADRFRPRTLIPLAAALIATGPLLIWRGGGVWAAAVALGCGALGQSLGSATAGANLARFFGRAQHGAIRASVARIGVIGAGLGPLCTGASVSLTASYGAALVGLALLCLPVVLAACWLDAPGVPGPRSSSDRDG